MKRVILYLDDEGNWVAECMNPQCAGQAKTKQKALEQVQKAIQFMGQLELADGDGDGPFLDPDTPLSDLPAIQLIVYEIKSRPSAALLN